MNLTKEQEKALRNLTLRTIGNGLLVGIAHGVTITLVILVCSLINQIFFQSIPFLVLCGMVSGFLSIDNVVRLTKERQVKDKEEIEKILSNK